jgi:hypothetical protein
MQYWLATLIELDKELLGQMWIRPLYYLDTTRDKPFYAMNQTFKNYRTETLREKFIAERIPQLQLFI